jgi:predicted GNAT family N-acyltransferase
MAKIELMSWEAARTEASRIRFAVFVEEQGVPREIELDEMDSRCIHALAFDEGRAVGTGRLLPDAHIGRMAVLEGWRGRGVGGLILEALIAKARERGERKVFLSAQVHATEFYVRHGFSAIGEIYEEAGIPHRAMERALQAQIRRS